MTYIVKSVTNNQYTVKVVNQNGSLLQVPTTVPTVTTSAISDLSKYSTTVNMLANDATTYANAITYIDNKSYVNTSQLTATLFGYQTTIGLPYAVSLLDSNNATYLTGVTIATIDNRIQSNATVAYINAVAYVDGKFFVTGPQLSGNLALYQTTAGLSTNVATLTANNANYLGGTLAASYVNTSGAYTISGLHTHNANIIFGSTAAIIANGLFGTAGQVLASNGTGMYWNTVSGVNTDAQYIWSNTQTFSNTITFSQVINGTANNANYLGGIIAASYVNTSQLSSNLALYQTTAGLSTNVATLTANNTLYLGGTIASGYQTTAGLSANIATLTSNNALYLGGIIASGYQTTAGLSTNVATLTANNTNYLGGVNLATIQTQFSSNDATTYSNAITFASNATNISSGTLNAARLPYSINQNLNTANSVTFNSISLTTGTISTLPSTGNDIVNKTYADAIATGVNFHPAVRLATAASFDSTTATYNNGSSGVGATITKNSPYAALSIDSTAVAYNDRILMKDSTNTVWNGVYSVTNTGSASYAWVLTRAYDYDQVGSGTNEIDQGDLIYVTSGSSLAGSSWVEQQVVTTIGTSPITFVQFSSKALYPLTNGAGLYYSVGGAYDGSAAATLAVNTTYIGTLTANNALYLGGIIAASYVNTSQLSSNLALYQTTAGLSANVATLTSNNALYLGGIVATSYVNSAQLSSNLALYQTTAGLSANVATLTANNTNYLGTVPAASYINTSGAYTITGIHTHNANVVLSSGLSANGSYGTAGQLLTSNGTVAYWSTVTAGSGVNTDAQYTWTNTQTHSANIVLNNNKDLNFKTLSGAVASFIQQNDDNFVFYTTNTTGGTKAVFNVYANTDVPNQNSAFRFNVPIDINSQRLYANGSSGGSGQLLTSNGTGTYWSSPGAVSINTDAQYTWSNTQTFSNTITFSQVINGTANNANYLGGTIASGYQTTAGLSANVATLTANNSTNFGGLSLTTVQSQITGNASTAYTNAVNYVTAGSYVNTAQLSANLSNYQTTAGLSANVATLTANNANYLGTIAAASYVTNSGNYTVSGNLNFTGTNNYFTSIYIGANSLVNTTTHYVGNSTANTIISNGQISLSGITINSTSYGGSANNTSYLGGTVASGYQTTAGLSANVATLTSNNALYLGGIIAASYVNSSQLSSNLTNYQTTAGLSSNVATLTSNNTLYLGGILASGYQTTAGLSANVATLTANNTLYLGGIVAASYVNSAQLSSNLTSYQTTAGLSANVATLTANNANNLNGQPASYYTNATNITTGTLPYAQLGSAVVNTSGSFTLAGDFTFSANLSSTGWINIEGYTETKASPTITSGALTLDLASASVFDVSLNNTVTSFTISNTPATANKTTGFVLIFTADGTARTVAWPGSVKWANNSPPTITSTNTKKDVYVFFTTDNGTSYNGFISGQNI